MIKKQKKKREEKTAIISSYETRKDEGQGTTGQFNCNKFAGEGTVEGGLNWNLRRAKSHL